MDALQQKVGTLVASLLGQPSVASDDNFFLLGGHSMLAAQLVAQIDDLFGVKLYPAATVQRADGRRAVGRNHAASQEKYS